LAGVSIVKAILGIHRAAPLRWVGNGFPVHTLFSYEDLGEQLSPFLLLDHAGPAEFAPTEHTRGVAEHPHRGFETVTIVYEGELEHHDSAGNGGRIGAGDVQWMTAAGGLMHEENHSESFARRGGTLEMAQLWVNLPARSKMSRPSYQTLLAKQIPSIDLPRQAGALRVIAGEYAGRKGPARTFTAMHVWDMRLHEDGQLSVPVTPGYSTAVAVLSGRVLINAAERAEADSVVVFERAGDELLLKGETGTRMLLLSGQPLNEPIVGYGQFVMNTPEEIQQAISDLHRGHFGRPVP
jgi:quercetin 2,3-dioxygenase